LHYNDNTEQLVVMAATLRPAIQREHIVAFHGNNGYANAPQLYVLLTVHSDHKE